MILIFFLQTTLLNFNFYTLCGNNALKQKTRTSVAYYVYTYFCTTQQNRCLRMKMSVYWDIAPCSLAEVYRRFEVLAAFIIRTP
jgi:hypothetical protein